jgi:hypothetical protein
MKKEFIPYEQALALKELGFDEPCVGYYENDVLILCYDSKQDYELLLNCAAPLYQQAFRWFREKYRLDGKPEYFLNDWYCFIINDMKGEDNSRRLFTEFPSYEEAELECLKKLIEIVKEK